MKSIFGIIVHLPEMNTENQGLFPTAYFPPVSYIVSMRQNDSVSIEIHETYPKQTIRNRCNILSSNGILKLTVPVKKPDGNNTKTKSVQIFQEEDWQKKHFRAIESAYKSSPFFDYYIHHFIPVFENQYENLVELNETIFKIICKILKINLPYSFTEQYEKQPENLIDYRQTFDSENYRKTIDFEPYTQVFSDRFSFEADLSILDLIFNLGPQTGEYLRKHS
jgi:hypothetical protein